MKKLWAYFQDMRRHAKNGHLPVWRQMLDVVVLMIVRNIGPGHYLGTRLWRREISWSEKMAQRNEKDYARLVNKRNDPLYQKISNHKPVDKALLILYGIPTPRFYGFLDPVRGTTFDTLPLRDADDLEALVERHNLTKICFKLPENCYGEGFVAAECIHSDGGVSFRKLTQKDSWGATEFCEKVLKFQDGNSYQIEQYLEQDPWFKAFNPTSLNTLRVIAVWRDDEPEPRVLDSMMRSGVKGELIDSRSKGGIFARIDAETGILGPGYNNSDKDHITYTRHPENGCPIEGEKVPRWEEVKALVCKTLRLYPKTRYIGFDIAMGLDGPCVIETNVRPAKTGVAVLGLPVWEIVRPTGRSDHDK